MTTQQPANTNIEAPDQKPKSELELLIEDISYAYSIYTTQGCNTDFAEFAGLSVDQFQRTLKRPGLTARQLRRLVRRGCESHRKQEAATQGWSDFIAHYISDTANINLFD
tara:strand:+ start:112 stop:441 length:330 start_codon:yes stop_codon:yes gene_type:complete